jgi:hypothetical protein
MVFLLTQALPGAHAVLIRYGRAFRHGRAVFSGPETPKLLSVPLGLQGKEATTAVDGRVLIGR